MPQHQSNQILWFHDGTVWLDVSTSKFPHAVTIVDELDIHRVLDGRGRWHAAIMGNGVYVGRGRVRPARSGTWLHRHLMDMVPGDGRKCDHKNHDTFDNRSHNLRDSSHAQNMLNRRSAKGSTSPYLGVSWNTKISKWKAQRWVDGKALCLGYFDVELEAARAYDDAVRGNSFANLNFPDAAAA